MCVMCDAHTRTHAHAHTYKHTLFCTRTHLQTRPLNNIVRVHVNACVCALGCGDAVYFLIFVNCSH